jgi:hypothetical protein
LTKATVRVVKKGRLGHKTHPTPNPCHANPLAFSGFPLKVYECSSLTHPALVPDSSA